MLYNGDKIGKMKLIRKEEPSKPNDYLYTTKEAAKILRVHQRTVFRYIKSDKLAAIKIGQWRIKKENLDKLIK
ncbi:MAG: helix-turn-helix domain-containing protein [Candidatus Falkowbacteria bacterium]|nr:helix-turn-helix domain-containing protein [Candidatus Falkowbacteria bacterium]